jgi:acetylornithine deacetylase
MGDPIPFLQALIGAQRVGETAVQALVAEAAGRLGCEVETRRYKPAEVPMVAEFASTQAIDADERASVVATFKGTGHGRSVIFFAHPDGEKLAGTERWQHDPFAGAVENGRLYGWGVADDLSGVAILVEGLRKALEAGHVPKGDVILASTPSKRHARGVSALLHQGLSADAAVYLHPAESGVGLREIKAFCLGQLDFRITVQGRAPDTSEISHLAFAHRALNPATALAAIQLRLAAFADDRAARRKHPLLEQAIGRSSNLLVSHVSVGASGIQARVAVQGVMEGALSLLPGESLSEIQAAVERVVAGEGCVEWLSGVCGAEVPLDHPLYRLVARAIERVTGQAPRVNPLHTASDIRNPIVQKNIPTVGLGPLGGDLTQNGLTDEWVDVADYRRAVGVAAEIIAGWCG